MADGFLVFHFLYRLIKGYKEVDYNIVALYYKHVDISMVVNTVHALVCLARLDARHGNVCKIVWLRKIELS